LRFGFFVQDRFDPGDVTANMTNARSFLQLAGGLLETQVKLLLLQLRQVITQLVRRLEAQGLRGGFLLRGH